MAFFQEIRSCSVPDSTLLGDGICHNLLNYNTPECYGDYGDCSEFNERYPHCNAENPTLLSNDRCDGGMYNTPECNFDNGSCDFFNEEYPNCQVDYPFLVGNGICDDNILERGRPLYNTPACGFDGGDCECMFEGCHDFYRSFPLCIINRDLEFPFWISDGWCDDIPPYNTEECGYDGGDCPNPVQPNAETYPDCYVSFPKKLGDGYCDDFSPYNTQECGFDGSDCIPIPMNRFDGDKCFALPQEHHLVGNNVCDDFKSFNSEECDWDGFDCIMEEYPDCHGLNINPSKIGDGFCDVGLFNEQCQWDLSDCDKMSLILSSSEELNDDIPFSNNHSTSFHKDNPNCNAPFEFLFMIGDGICDEIFNNENCTWDGFDCLNVSNDIQCNYNHVVKNSNCDIEANTPECNFDGGDCDFLNVYLDHTSSYMYNRNTNSTHVFSNNTVLFINGKKTSVKDYKQNTLILSTVQTITSIISFLASSTVMWVIKRSFIQLSSVQNRLLFGLSSADLISSLALALSTLPTPKEYDHIIWNAHGSSWTCSTQGFLIFIGTVGAPLYNCSMCIYYYLVVKISSQGRPADQLIKKRYEPFLHGIPLIFSFVGATTVLSMSLFNPNMTFCYIGSPMVCNDGGSKNCNQKFAVNTLYFLFTLGSYIFLPLVIVISMSVIYRAVLALEMKQNVFIALSGGDDTRNKTTLFDSETMKKKVMKVFDMLTRVSVRKENMEAVISRSSVTRRRRDQKSRATLSKARAYSIAFLLTYTFPMIISIRSIIGLESSFSLSLLARIFFPLQGFFNFFVFIYAKVLKEKSRNKITWMEAFKNALLCRGQRKCRGSLTRSNFISNTSRMGSIPLDRDRRGSRCSQMSSPPTTPKTKLSDELNLDPAQQSAIPSPSSEE